MAASFYDNFVVAKDGSVESLCSYQARINKPKKTRSKGPALVFALTEVEQQKLEQEKSSLLEYKKSVITKAFSKIATFSYLKNMRASGGTTAENSGSNRIMSNSSTLPDSTAGRAHSFPTASGLRSALKDRNEETGSCTRSKQRVKWASDVEECTNESISNTPGQLIACSTAIPSQDKERGELASSGGHKCQK